MKDQIKTLEYFKNCLIDPFFEVFRILNNSSHAQYKNLLNDLNSIDKSILEKYIEEYNYVIAKINLLKDKDQGRRAFCFASQTNSSYWISCTIIRLTEEKGLNFKIRLDPFIEEYKSEYKIMFQKMLVYGKPLDWERLRRLKEEEYGQWLDEKTYSKIGTTDFVWRPMGNEIHFTCEELPKINCLDYRGSRFFHAIFDKITGNIKHCDGAIRFYTLEEFKKRTQYHVRNTQVRKIGTRIKIFQIDDFIDQNVFTTLAATFFVWNEDIQKYFGGE
jgi:hypothetical protein